MCSRKTNISIFTWPICALEPKMGWFWIQVVWAEFLWPSLKCQPLPLLWFLTTITQVDTPQTTRFIYLGVFSFEHDHFQVIESCGHLNLKVCRSSGCRGEVIVPYKTYDGTATGGKHYEVKEGEIHFDNNQTEFVCIKYPKHSCFQGYHWNWNSRHRTIWT